MSNPIHWSARSARTRRECAKRADAVDESRRGAGPVLGAKVNRRGGRNH